MSIATEITRLQNAKSALKSAIENKGVTVPSSTKLDGYSSLVRNIPTGGGGEGTEIELDTPMIYLCNNMYDRNALSGNLISFYQSSTASITSEAAIPTIDPFYDICVAGSFDLGIEYYFKFTAGTHVSISGTSVFSGVISSEMEIFDNDGNSYLPKRYRIGDLMWGYDEESEDVGKYAGGVINLEARVGSVIRRYKIYCANTERSDVWG